MRNHFRSWGAWLSMAGQAWQDPCREGTFQLRAQLVSNRLKSWWWSLKSMRISLLNKVLRQLRSYGLWRSCLPIKRLIPDTSVKGILEWWIVCKYHKTKCKLLKTPWKMRGMVLLIQKLIGWIYSLRRGKVDADYEVLKNQIGLAYN